MNINTVIRKLHDLDITIRLNPYVGAAAAVAVLLTINEQDHFPDSAYGLTILAIHLITLVMLPVIPRIAGWMATLVLIVSSALPYPAPQQSIGVCVALAVLSFYSERSGAILAMLGCIFGFALASMTVTGGELFAGDTDYSYKTVVHFIAISITCALAAGAGQILRHGKAEADKRAKRQRETEQQLAVLRHDAQLAITIHDTMTNDLTFISTIARLHLSDYYAGKTAKRNPEHVGAPDELRDDKDDWALVLDRSQRAFKEVHHVIDYLSGRLHDNQQLPFMERLSQQIDDVREFLTSLGYGGHVHVEGLHLAHSPDAEREALSLIREIGTNIRRHAAPGDDVYLLNILCTEHYIEIREINDIGSNADGSAEGAVVHTAEAELSGRGLNMHAKRIIELGGEINFNAADGTWIVYALIPWQREGTLSGTSSPMNNAAGDDSLSTSR
ncbi:hypothetical protein [Bifidobacterium phasiani]|uniref:Uncharacterized protein n=1 Tax=Bifidobacterium phasiani TaxID=2834431 RepID=A0ABS6WB75_9BIFI|nr:hypothetical protein [Bifidobacterium phasiani]MBW3083749.1 hypothetical protein [Bifidobacterium phasiani]